VFVKLTSVLLIPLLLIGGLADVASQVTDPYERLAGWLNQNLGVYGLTLYRGDAYDVIGAHKEPLIKYSVRYPNGTYRSAQTDRFSDYVDKLRRGEVNPWVNLTYFGYEKIGPIVAVWPPFSFIYNLTVDPISTLWGSYFPKNWPSTGFMSSEAEPYTLAVFDFPISEPVFSAKPQYLYSYLKMANGTVVTLPKGENINFVILPIGDVKFEEEYLYTALNIALTGRGNLPMPSSLREILNALPKDDPLASVLTINWSVEGNKGYIKPITAINYTHIKPQELTLVAYYSGVMRRANETYEEWYRKSVENAVKEIEKTSPSLKFDKLSTRVLSPAGIPLKEYSTMIDLSNTSPATMLLATGVSFIIEPSAYGGNVDLKLTISDVRGRFSLTYKYTIGIGEERFKVSVDGFLYKSKSSKPAGYRFENKIVSQWWSSIDIKKKGYDEDGSLILSLSLRESYHMTSTLVEIVSEGNKLVEKPVTQPEGGALERYEERTYSAQGGGEIKIGGWIPNPPPPGDIIEVQNPTITGSEVSIKKDIELQPQPYHPHIRRFRVETSAATVNCGPNVNCTEYWVKYEEALDFAREQSYELPFKYAQVGRDYYVQTNKLVELNPYLLVSYGSSPLKVVTALRNEKVTAYSSGREIEYDIKRESRELGVFKKYSHPCCGEVYAWGVEELNYPVTNTKVISDHWEGEEYMFYPFNRTRIYDTTGTVGEAPKVKAPDTLTVYLENNRVVTNENVTGYIAAYGENTKGLKVRLQGYLTYNESVKIPVKVEPAIVVLNDVGEGFFTITTPTLQEINSTLKIKPLPSSLPLQIDAEDQRGLKSTFTATLRISGKLLVVDFRDIDVPLPTNIKQGSLLQNLKYQLFEDPLIDKPLYSKQGDGLYFYSDLVDKETKEVVIRIAPGDSNRAIVDLAKLNPAHSYFLNFTMSMETYEYGEWLELKIRDVGVDITIPDEDLFILKAKVYAPYSLLKRYIALSNALAGKDDQFRMLLADQAIPIQAIKTIFNINTQSSIEDPSDTMVKEILQTIINYAESVALHIGPKVLFPKIGTDEIKGTELEFLNTHLDYRNFRYRLSREDLKNPDNYWSKMGKLIVLQAHMLKNAHYAEYLTLAASRLMALAATLETYKGFFSYTKIWNRQNLFAKFNKMFPGQLLPKTWGTYTGTAKIGILTLEGDLLNVLGFTNKWFGGMTVLNEYLKDLYGSKDAASIAIAASFKLIRFLAAGLIGRGELWAEFSFEVIFQGINFIAAHTMMLLYNYILQMIAVGELEKNLDIAQLALASLGSGVLGIPPFFGLFLKSQIEPNPSYAQLVTPLRSSIRPSQKLTWSERNEKWSLLDLGWIMAYLEEDYYAVANLYKEYFYPISSIVLSTIRGLDGIRGKLKGDSFNAPEALLKFMNLPVTYQVPVKDGVKTFSTKLNDVVAKAYLALIAALLSDGLVKIIWNFGFYNFLVKGGEFERFASSVIIAAQALMPAFTFFLASRVTIRTGLRSASISAPQEATTLLFPLPSATDTTLTRAKVLSSNIRTAKVVDALPSPNLLQFNAAKSNRLSEIAEVIQSKGNAIVDSAQTLIYETRDLEELTDSIDEADLIIKSSLQSINDPYLTAELAEYGLTFTYNVFNLRLLIDFLIANPSFRPTKEYLNLLRVSFTELANITLTTSTIIQQAERKGLLPQPEGPIIIVRTSDILWAEDRLMVTVHNIGGSDAKVALVLTETPIYTSAKTEEVVVKSRDSITLTLKPTLKQKLPLKTFIGIGVYVNGELAYDVQTEAELSSDLYEAKEGNLTVVSDGPVVFSGGKVRLTNSTFVIIIIEGGGADHYVLQLNGRVVRSGLIMGKGAVAVSSSFRSPTAGTVELKKVSAESSSFSGVRRAEPIKGVTLTSAENIEGRVTLYKENPYAEAKLANVDKAVFLAVDISGASRDVAIVIRYGDLGFNDPAKLMVYKYSAEYENYIPIEFQINREEKTITANLKPGDPILAIVQRKTIQGTTQTTTQTTAASITTTQTISSTTSSIAPPISVDLGELGIYVGVIVIAAIMLAALSLMKRRKQLK